LWISLWILQHTSTNSIHTNPFKDYRVWLYKNTVDLAIGNCNHAVADPCAKY
jgi:hypothetical protein